MNGPVIATIEIRRVPLDDSLEILVDYAGEDRRYTASGIHGLEHTLAALGKEMDDREHAGP